MIIQIREKIKGSASKVIIWTMVLVLLISFLAPMLVNIFTGKVLWIARVNGTKVGIGQLRFQKFSLENQIKQIRFQYADQPYIADLVLQMQGLTGNLDVKALEDTIRNTLLDQSFNKLGIHLNEDHIIQAFPFDEANIAYIANQLSGQGIRLEDFEKNIINGLQRELLYNLVSLAAYVPAFEVKQQFANEYLPKQFTVLSLSLKDVLQQIKQNPADQKALESFYEQHKNSYWVPEKRSATTWTFTAGDYDLNVSDQAIEKYYERNKSQYVLAPVKVQVRRLLIKQSPEARQTIENVYQEAKANPEQFEQLVQKHSQDEQSIKQGGLLPFISRGEGKDVAFERAALLLQQDGQVSDIIETEDGFEILQRVARKSKEYKPLNLVKDEIRKLLANNRFASQFKVDIAKFKNDPQKLVAFIENKKAKKEVLVDKTSDGTKLSGALFNIKKENGFTAITPDGKGVLIQLNAVTKRSLPPFEQIKEQVATDYYTQKASKKLAELLNQAKKIAIDDSLQEAQKIVGGSLQQTGLITKDAKKTEELKKQGLPVYKMLQIENIGGVLEQLNDSAGYLIRLDEVASFDQEKYREKKPDLAEQLEQVQKDLIFKGFVASLYRNATIETNKEILTK